MSYGEIRPRLRGVKRKLRGHIACKVIKSSYGTWRYGSTVMYTVNERRLSVEKRSKMSSKFRFENTLQKWLHKCILHEYRRLSPQRFDRMCGGSSSRLLDNLTPFFYKPVEKYLVEKFNIKNNFYSSFITMYYKYV